MDVLLSNVAATDNRESHSDYRFLGYTDTDLSPAITGSDKDPINLYGVVPIRTAPGTFSPL